MPSLQPKLTKTEGYKNAWGDAVVSCPYQWNGLWYLVIWPNVILDGSMKVLKAWLIFKIMLCSRVCVCVFSCGIWVCGTCAHVHTQRPEEDIRSHPVSLSTLFPETSYFRPPHLALCSTRRANMCCYVQNATWTPDLGPPTYPYLLTPHPIPTKQ